MPIKGTAEATKNTIELLIAIRLSVIAGGGGLLAVPAYLAIGAPLGASASSVLDAAGMSYLLLLVSPVLIYLSLKLKSVVKSRETLEL